MPRYTDIKKMKLLDPMDKFDIDDINSNFQKISSVYPMNPVSIEDASSEVLMHGYDYETRTTYNDTITPSWKVLIYADGRFEAVCKFDWTKSINVSYDYSEMFEHATYVGPWDYWCVKVTFPQIQSGGVNYTVNNAWIEPNVVVGTSTDYPNGRSVWPTQPLMTSSSGYIYGYFGLNTIGTTGKLGVPLTIHLYATGRLNGYSDSTLRMLNATDPVDVGVYNDNFKLLNDVKNQSITHNSGYYNVQCEFTGANVKRTYYGVSTHNSATYTKVSLRPSSGGTYEVGYVFESPDIDLTGEYDAGNVFIINSSSFVKMNGIRSLVEGNASSDCIRSRIRIKNNNFSINSIGLSNPFGNESQSDGYTANLTFISLS